MGSRASPVSGQFVGRGLDDTVSDPSFSPDESFTIDHIGGTAGQRDDPGHRVWPLADLQHVAAIYAGGGIRQRHDRRRQGRARPGLHGRRRRERHAALRRRGRRGHLRRRGERERHGRRRDRASGRTPLVRSRSAAAPPATRAISPTRMRPASPDAGSDYIVDNSSDPGVHIYGSNGGDSITGGYGAGDVIVGGSGNDVISSRGPSDQINGGAGQRHDPRQHAVDRRSRRSTAAAAPTS